MAAWAETELRRVAAIFKVLGHPERVRIAARLAEGPPITQHELLEELPWAQSTLARHVAVMRNRGLVAATRHGNEVHLRLATDLVPQLLELITTHRPAGPAGDTAATSAAVGGASS